MLSKLSNSMVSLKYMGNVLLWVGGVKPQSLSWSLVEAERAG